MAETLRKEETKAKAELSEKPLDKMTVNDLRAVAKEIPGVSGVHSMKKDELLKIINKDKGDKDEKPLQKKKGKKTQEPPMSVKEIKAKILFFQKEKQTAREAMDRHKVDILRRRINRLKKQSRKVARA